MKWKRDCLKYIMTIGSSSITSDLLIQSKKLSLSGNIPGKDFPYSDHEGLEVVFEVKDRITPIPVQNMLLGGVCVCVCVCVCACVRVCVCVCVCVCTWI